MKTILSIKNLSKKFGSLTAVDDLSLQVKEGEIFSLIGPNGSGKTTIIKIIVGLLKPSRGNVQVMKFDIEKNPIKAKAETGYIPDEPNVWNHLTGEEFLHLIGTLYNLDEEERKKRIEKLLKIYELRGIETGYFQNYSRGNKQKITILAALLHRPKLLLIDEPIVGLDPKSISTTKRELQKYAKESGTIFMATHVLSVAQDIATKIGVLKEGKLIEVGTLNELRDKAKLSSDATLEEVYLTLTEK